MAATQLADTAWKMSETTVMLLVIGAIIVAACAPAAVPTTQQGDDPLGASLTNDTDQDVHVGKFAGGDPDQQQQSGMCQRL